MASSRPKVLAVIETYNVSGPAKNLLRFAEWTRESELADVLIATYVRGAATNAFIDAARAKNLDVSVIAETRRFDSGAIDRLREVVAEKRPDILQTHNIKSNFFARRIRAWEQRPWVAFHHGYTATSKWDQSYNWVNRWSLRRVTHAVTVCGAFARHIERDCGVDANRITVLHNAVRPIPPLLPEKRAEVRRTLGAGPDETLLLTVGRFSREKAHADLIEAFAIVSRQAPRARLILAGDGPERAKLEAQVRARGVEDRVMFLGYRSDVLPLYGAADISVLPSHSEGSPNALLEAMGAGLPSVATRVGGVPEIATDGETALLVPSAQPQDLARAILRLIGDPALAARLGRAAVDVVEANYSPDVHGKKLVSLYRRLLDE